MSRQHKRITPMGMAMGKNAARMAAIGLAHLESLGLDQVKAPMIREQMCTSCACRPDTVPNGCLQTQMDFLKSAHEGLPFRCHSPSDGRICTGWLYARAALAEMPLPPEAVALIDKWEYTPPDVEKQALGDA